MYHNLTERQLKALRWIVQQVKSLKLEETFMTVRTMGGFGITELKETLPEYLDHDALNALVHSDILINAEGSKYTLTRRAYEIADFDFFNPNPDPLLNYIKETHHLLQRHFNKDELSRVCFELGVNEWVFGDNPDRPFELLLYLYRYNRLNELEPILQEQRQAVDWPPFAVEEGWQ